MTTTLDANPIRRPRTFHSTQKDGRAERPGRTACATARGGGPPVGRAPPVANAVSCSRRGGRAGSTRPTTAWGRAKADRPCTALTRRQRSSHRSQRWAGGLDHLHHRPGRGLPQSAVPRPRRQRSSRRSQTWAGGLDQARHRRGEGPTDPQNRLPVVPSKVCSEVLVTPVEVRSVRRWVGGLG